MRVLTFEGFLKKYINELSYSKSNRLTRLATEAAEQNPRLREPLLLFTCLTHSQESAQQLLAKNESMKIDYNHFFAQYQSSEKLLESLKTGDNELPDTYKKVFKSYLSVRNRFQSDNHTKSLMKAKIQKLQEEKNVTDYRLYTDLHINPGNFNAFMKHDRLDRLSLEKAQSILRHLETYQALR
jgi:hypothetical protein